MENNEKFEQMDIDRQVEKIIQMNKAQKLTKSEMKQEYYKNILVQCSKLKRSYIKKLINELINKL